MDKNNKKYYETELQVTNYSSQIKLLPVIEGIRKRPGMYIGSTDDVGIEHLIGELIANVVDLFLRNQASKVVIKTSKNKIVVSDDGPGLPFWKEHSTGINYARHFLTDYHNSPSADGHFPHVHFRFCGVGIVALNALSSKLIVTSIHGSQKWTCICRKGKIVEEKIEDAKNGKGTRFEFHPDMKIFSNSTVHSSFFRQQLFEYVHLFPKFKIKYNKETFFAPRGLADLVPLYRERSDLREQIFALHKNMQHYSIQVAALGKSTRTSWRSWVNGVMTPLHGTHVRSFAKALRHVNWKPKVALIHITMNHPQFAGPTKWKLESRQFAKSIKELIISELGAWIK